MIQVDIWMLIALISLYVSVWALVTVGLLGCVIINVAGMIQNPSLWGWHFFWLVIWFTVFSFLIILFSNQWKLREKYLWIYKEIPANIATVFRYLLPTKEPSYSILRSGKILFLPLFFKEEEKISLMPEVFDEGKLEVNSIDAQKMRVDFQLQVWVRGDDKAPSLFFLNARGAAKDKPQRDIMLEIAKSFLHTSLNLVTSEDPADCTALKLAEADQGRLYDIGKKTTDTMNGFLKKDFPDATDEDKDYGLQARVTIQSFDLPGVLSRAKTSAITAGLETDEVKKQAEGYRDALRTRGEGLKEVLEKITEASPGANPTWWMVAESLGPTVAQALRSFMEQRGNSSSKRKSSQKQE